MSDLYRTGLHMGIKTGLSAALKAATLLCVAVSASACLGPTYGTDKTATEQLISDLGNVASIKPPNADQTIAYTPRPEIVEPPNTTGLPLPEPSVAEVNDNWVESPEQTRERLIAEADANRNSTTYRSPLARPGTDSGDRPVLGRSPAQADAGPSSIELMEQDAGRPRRARVAQAPRLPEVNSPRARDAGGSSIQVLRENNSGRDRFQENLKISRGAYTDRRRFLSDPPAEFRQPAETAAVGDVGEPERAKERRRKAAATKDSKGFRLPKIPLPW